jgi:hypothetical protein
MADRYKWAQYPYVSMTTNVWSAMIADRKQVPMSISIGGSTSYDSITRALDVTLNGTALWELPFDVRLNAYIVESPVSGNGLGWDQLNGNNTTPGNPLNGLGDPILNYQHPRVLRDMLGGHHGQAGVLPQPVPAGHHYDHTFHTTLDPRWNANNVYVVILVQRHADDPEQREILNVAKIPLNAAVAAGTTPPALADFQLWPNPSDGRFSLNMPSATQWTATCTDLQGKHLWTQTFVGKSADLGHTDLASGTYLLRLSAEGKSPMVRKIIVQ